MTKVIVVVIIIVVVIACLVILAPDDNEGYKGTVIEVRRKSVIDNHNKELSQSIDTIQLLLSECPLNIKYIMQVYDITVEINNKYIYNKVFDVDLLNELLHSWDTSREKVRSQLINFQYLDNEFKVLKKLINKLFER